MFGEMQNKDIKGLEFANEMELFFRLMIANEMELFFRLMIARGGGIAH